MIGKDTKHPVTLFAGLFIYDGCGSGTYYSNTGERLWMGPSDATAMANSEGIPFVYLDSFDYVIDPTLEDKRRFAQNLFDKHQATEPAVG